MPSPAKQAPKPAHVLRPSASGNGRKAKPKALPSLTYPAGYFTALCVRDGWPYKGWKPSEPTAAEVQARKRSLGGHANSRAGVDAGKLRSIAVEGTPCTAPDIVQKLLNWRPR
jgi:hypothetical protein